MRINRNQFAKEVVELEGLKESMSIAQIKEVIKVIFSGFTLEEIVEVWQAYNK